MNSYNKPDNLEFKINTVSHNDLLKFYLDNDNSFSPSLSEQVNIADYVKKIKDNATTFEVWDNNIVGLIAGYFNDTEGKKAYITSVIISPNYQGRGIASRLLREVIDYACKNNFVSIGLEVQQSNEKALSIYKKFNFKIISQNQTKLKMERIISIL
jgi:ribosomal-protein-alanine N-acetyltransferase